MAVYFARLVNQPDIVKIGHSCNVRRRLAELGKKLGPLELLKAIPGDWTTEKDVHSRFAKQNLQKELFKFGPEISRYMSELPDAPVVEIDPTRIPRYQCKGVGAKGRRCEKRIRGKHYCGLHDPKHLRCKAVLSGHYRRGSRCGRAGYINGYCWLHAQTPAQSEIVN